jgi:hypothetical protein
MSFIPNPAMESEDETADRIQSFTKWLDSTWEKNGALGRFFILILFVGIASPFIIGVLSVIIVWFWIVPFAITVTDKVFAFGVLFSLLTVLSLKVGGFANQMLLSSYLTRRKRRSKN